MPLRILIAGPALSFPLMGYTTRAFSRLGHTTIRFEYTNIWVNRLTSRALAGVPVLPALAARYAQGWRRDRDRALADLARRVRPDLVLILRGDLLSDEALAEIKRRARGPLVTWWMDDPARYPTSVSLNRWLLYDYVFLFDRACVRRLQALGATQVHFLPCACDETVFRPLTLSRRQQRRFGSEIALVGWFYPNRAKVVNALREFRLGVCGRGWATQAARAALNGTDRAVIRSRWFVSDACAATIYNAAAIGLNIHHDQTREAGLNTRSFELLAAGAFELVDAIPGMEELLIPGEEVAVYRSAQEARELARHYLRHPDERVRIAARGRARVLHEHTYVHRVRTLLQVLNRRAPYHGP